MPGSTVPLKSRPAPPVATAAAQLQAWRASPKGQEAWRRTEAFPSLPTLPRAPEQIEVDGWLGRFDGFHVERKIDAHGVVHLDLRAYYVDVRRAGQRVTLEIQATSRCMLIWHEGTLLKTVPLRGLAGVQLSFARFVEYMVQQARAQHRLRTLQDRRKRTM
jgi:hypothetical protein